MNVEVDFIMLKYRYINCILTFLMKCFCKLMSRNV